MKYAITFFALTFVVLIPEVALALSKFVTCSGTDCSFCNLVEMGNAIIKWFIGIGVVLFVVLITVAGFKLMTSGGDVSAYDNAKKLLINALIGFIIILAAWLLVDTLMRGLLKGGNGNIEGWGPWQTVKCFKQVKPVGDALDGAGDEAGGEAAPDDGVPGSCEPLSPITDSAALAMEGGSKIVWTGADPRLQAAAQKLKAAIGGSITSAYRPASYQAHLKEIHTKWCGAESLQSNTDASCSAVKSAVGSEFSKHGLSCARPVATNSRHTAGTAVDISPGNRPAPAGTCFKWFGPGDKVHYTLISGCTPN